MMKRKRQIKEEGDSGDDLNAILEREYGQKNVGWTVQKLPKKIQLPDLPSTIQDCQEWNNVERRLVAGILSLGLTTPTPVQRGMLELMVKSPCPMQIVGSAPTGSGKTLAYALPLLNSLCAALENNIGLSVHSMVLCPTRELALQVADHLRSLARFIFPQPEKSILALVGGMSADRQERLLSNRPPIIVATPGRLSELVEFNEYLRMNVQNVEYLVIDEADRMVMDKYGGFPELERIFSCIKDGERRDRKVLLFSATLSSEKIRTAIHKLKGRLGFTKPAQLHIDGRPTELQEFKSLVMDKDKFLYSFLNSFQSGKSMIFVNSIEAVRRYLNILKLLLPLSTICPLHAQQQQRQRLKYLDRFKEGKQTVLICTDVAARGLDIPAVDCVIQAECPGNMDIYRHRVGRTARAGKSGLSIMLLNPKDAALMRESEVFKGLYRDLKEYELPGISDERRLEGMLETVREIEHLLYASARLKKAAKMKRVVKEELGNVDDDESDISEGMDPQTKRQLLRLVSLLGQQQK